MICVYACVCVFVSFFSVYSLLTFFVYISFRCVKEKKSDYHSKRFVSASKNDQMTYAPYTLHNSYTLNFFSIKAKNGMHAF